VIQAIANKITLSSLSLLNAEQYKVVQLRFAEIPLTWHNRPNWLKMFELLATVIVKVEDEQRITSCLVKSEAK
jgi:hypothetical protein